MFQVALHFCDMLSSVKFRRDGVKARHTAVVVHARAVGQPGAKRDLRDGQLAAAQPPIIHKAVLANIPSLAFGERGQLRGVSRPGRLIK